MGLSKVSNKGNGKIVLVHQLGQDGKPYAEDVTIEVQPGVDPKRLEWWASMDGKIGVVNLSFSVYDQEFTNIQFPIDITKTTQELRDYYKNRFHFDDVDFVPPGSFGGVEPLDQFGKIILTRNGVVCTIVVNDILWQQGFDGIGDLMNQADINWDLIDHDN